MSGATLRAAMLWLVAVVLAAAAGTAAVRLATTSVTDPLDPIGLSLDPAPGASPASTSPSATPITPQPSPTTPTPDSSPSATTAPASTPPTLDPPAADQPTARPSDGPSETVSDEPSDEPTERPSDEPSERASDEPTERPSDEPTDGPSDEPSEDDREDAAPTTRTVSSTGGTARFRFAGGEVEVVFATPAQGFRVEIQESGGGASVRFRSNDHESQLEARYRDGQPTVDVEEDAKD